MLLSQQAQLVRLDGQRAVIRVAGTWMAMVQSRLALLEAAFSRALGAPRQLVLESGDPASVAAAPVPAARPVPPAAPAPAAASPAPDVRSTDQPAASPASGPPPAAASPEPQAPSRPEPPAIIPPPQPSAPLAGAALAPAPATAAPPTVAVPLPPRSGTSVEEKARQLADFFNGEVVLLPDDPEAGDAPPPAPQPAQGAA